MTKNSSYQILLDVAVGKATGSYRVLEDLKEQFYNDIDSRRRYSCIVTFGELVDCLHRRDVLTDEEHQQLLLSSGQLKGSNGNAIAIESSASAAVGVNQYRQQRLAAESQHRASVQATHTDDEEEEFTKAKNAKPQPPAQVVDPLAGAWTATQRKDTFRLIVREIGRKWKDLARELDFTQSQIAAIEMEYPRDLSSCVYKVLEEDEKEQCETASGTHLKRLCEALQACGRADLVRRIKKIMS